MAIEEIVSIRETLRNKIDDLRYTFIDEIKEFYEQEAGKLVDFQGTITNDENMIKIQRKISSISSRDEHIQNEDKLLLDPIKIIEEKKKESINDNQVHVAYKVGEYESDEGSGRDSKDIINEEDYTKESVPCEFSPKNMNRLDKRLSVDMPNTLSFIDDKGDLVKSGTKQSRFFEKAK